MCWLKYPNSFRMEYLRVRGWFDGNLKMMQSKRIVNVSHCRRKNEWIPKNVKEWWLTFHEMSSVLMTPLKTEHSHTNAPEHEIQFVWNVIQAYVRNLKFLELNSFFVVLFCFDWSAELINYISNEPQSVVIVAHLSSVKLIHVCLCAVCGVHEHQLDSSRNVLEYSLPVCICVYNALSFFFFSSHQFYKWRNLRESRRAIICCEEFFWSFFFICSPKYTRK